MNKEKFEDLVEAAVDSIPKEFKKVMKNITVMVSDFHPQSPYILGIYHGVPFQHRGPYYGNLPPDVIVIYQKAIERICHTEQEIKDQVRKVVIHEIGHYFGFSEAQLRELESPDSSKPK